jgi:hypothetical protein
MKKIIIILGCLSFFTTITLIAQPNNNSIKDIVMPPPNAASLGKYGDIPVSYATGVPNVGIPIYTLKEGSVNLPVSLSYHASGMKVGEMSSWVGLGWSLQAGGMISRTVQGRADEGASGYFTVGSQISVNNNGTVNPGTIGVTIGTIESGAIDAEPDIFSYSVGGTSGKFFFDSDGKAVTIPKQDVKIEKFLQSGFGAERLYQLIITTSDGTKYYFGSLDSDPSSARIGIEKITNNDNFIEANGWMLRKIVSADENSTINLTYSPEEYFYLNRASSSSNTGISITTPKGNFNANKAAMSGWRLNIISTSTEAVTFVPGTTRLDLNYTSTQAAALQPKSLGSVKLTTGTYCKEWQMNYDYFVDNSANATNGEPDKRLKLLSVQEKNCTGAILVPAHTFSYYEKAGSPNFLPNRFSTAIDHWGHYNGADNNPAIGKNIPPTHVKYQKGINAITIVP